LNESQKKQLPIETRYSGIPAGFANSITPNIANSIAIENSQIIPDPHNEAFAEYTAHEYEKLGTIPRFSDSWPYHRSLGNLHCGSNVLRICRPTENKGRNLTQ
jgi:hypothetical protein